MDKYFKILEELPEGHNVTPEMARRLNIPEKLIPIITMAYKSGRIRGSNRGTLSKEDVASKIKTTKVSKDILELQGMKTSEDISNLLSKTRAKVNRRTAEQLKREFNVLNEVFTDEPIPKSWMATELRKVTSDTKQDWDMVIRSELKNNQLEGMAESIVNGSSVYSIDKEDTIVFKKPNPDACEHCKKHYLERDGITPKLFKLSELMANGTNIGRKVSEWRPTLAILHPHCQCDLHVMPKNATFDENGNMVIKPKSKGGDIVEL